MVMPRRVRVAFQIVLALGVVSAADSVTVARADAQSSDSGSMRSRSRGRPGGEASQPADRAAREQMFQQRIEKVLRDRVSFTDEQLVKWRAWNTRFADDRRALDREDRELRMILRHELAPGVTPNEAKLTDALARWPQLQRKRASQLERELKALSAFLPPVQRARFFAFQDELRRGAQEPQWRRDGGESRGRDTAGVRGGRGGGGPPGRGDRRSPTDSLKFPGSSK